MKDYSKDPSVIAHRLKYRKLRAIEYVRRYGGLIKTK